MSLLKSIELTWDHGRLSRRADGSAKPDEDINHLSRPGLIRECANPECRSGWLQLFRKRGRPIFEGAWTCSPECTEAQLGLAIRRELDGWVPAEQTHQHRIPLGLLMLQNGWITSNQLRKAVLAQKKGGTLRIGEWLVRQNAVDEAIVSRALSLQWGCPLLAIDGFNSSTASAMTPRLFHELFGALPIRVAAERILYLGFEERIDSVLAFALQRMTGLRVESGIVPSTAFRQASAQIAALKFPSIQFVDAVSSSSAAHVLARSIERFQPAASRLERVHQFLWLRMFSNSQGSAVPQVSSVSDVVCRIGAPD
jgi:hypothetical protein